MGSSHARSTSPPPDKSVADLPCLFRSARARWIFSWISAILLHLGISAMPGRHAEVSIRPQAQTPDTMPLHAFISPSPRQHMLEQSPSYTPARHTKTFHRQKKIPLGTPHRASDTHKAVPAERSIPLAHSQAPLPAHPSQAVKVLTESSFKENSMLLELEIPPQQSGTLRRLYGKPEQEGAAALTPEQLCDIRPKPTYPRRAIEDGIEKGEVVARLLLAKNGDVASVTILSANPTGYFEGTTRRTAMEWHCRPPASGDGTIRVPFEFLLQ